ncbi:MAG: class I SAM-dependent methyltransferase [Defluviitaleaceae bacterium]|nr:class I SAM-dependent methyltransferase [Defluviitaleaceae bacterium]
MLGEKGFDLWANGYDADVNLTDDDGKYPFAGYKDILAQIYTTIMLKSPCNVLDIGIGTGVLASKLEDGGNKVTGIDFSEEMLAITASKIPQTTLIKHDFTKGLPKILEGLQFDFIISTYAMHHLDDAAKINLIQDAAKLLAPGGQIIIGDIAFETEEAQNTCRTESGDEWDDDEFYLVTETLTPKLGQFSWAYRQISHCGGILTITP